jgi:hypothetical protein
MYTVVLNIQFHYASGHDAALARSEADGAGNGFGLLPRGHVFLCQTDSEHEVES